MEEDGGNLDRFAFEGLPQCRACYWYIGGMSCRAFGFDAIPIEITSGVAMHDKPWPGDNGRQFVSKKAVQEGKIPQPDDWD